MRVYTGIRDRNHRKIYEGDTIKQKRWSGEPRVGIVGKYKGEWAFLHPQYLTTHISIQTHRKEFEVMEEL